jgi:hypothetical protein
MANCMCEACSLFWRILTAETSRMTYFAWPASDFLAVAEWLCSGDDDLPDWLKKFLYVNEQGWDSFHYRQALYPLIQYGLLQLVEGEWPGVTMHGLVQWRAKKHHSDQAWDKWYLIFMTAASWQMALGQNEPLFRRYFDHASPSR